MVPGLDKRKTVAFVFPNMADHSLIPQLMALFERQAEPEESSWLKEEVSRQQASFDRRTFYFAFSGTSRKVGERPVVCLPAEQEAFETIVPGWSPRAWTLPQLARTLLLSVIPQETEDAYMEIVAQLFKTADLKESIALHASLFLQPFPESLVLYGQEGIRSNIQSVIDAVSLDNPFPAAHFPEMAWNQLVLKALFNGRPIHRIQGLEERANPALAKALSNYAHERWAASRWVSPELWRSCQSFLDETIVADLEKVAGDDATGQKEAVALIAFHSKCPEKNALEAHLKPYRSAIESGDLTWDGLGSQLEEASGQNG